MKCESVPDKSLRWKTTLNHVWWLISVISTLKRLRLRQEDRHLWVWDLPGLHTEFQASLSYSLSQDNSTSCGCSDNNNNNKNNPQPYFIPYWIAQDTNTPNSCFKKEICKVFRLLMSKKTPKKILNWPWTTLVYLERQCVLWFLEPHDLEEFQENLETNFNQEHLFLQLCSLWFLGHYFRVSLILAK